MEDLTAADVTPADLRAAVARDGRPLYMIAPLVGLHPATLGAVLRGRHPLSSEFAQRVLRALDNNPARKNSAP